ncbi:MAG: hypothetical protein EOP89_14765 [Lysobacteraceae bacterium]|nr:MAG: hypothetical protein EOP89_14765 [Xanthomonadaceae bacterium]
MVEHQRAAMSLLTGGKPLKPREGQFLGGIAFDANPLSGKQRNWLVILLDRHGLPPLTEGGEA